MIIKSLILILYSCKHKYDEIVVFQSINNNLLKGGDLYNLLDNLSIINNTINFNIIQFYCDNLINSLYQITI